MILMSKENISDNRFVFNNQSLILFSIFRMKIFIRLFSIILRKPESSKISSGTKSYYT